MNQIIKNYINIKQDITIHAKKWNCQIPKIIIASKYRSKAEILSLILAGHRDFAENTLQEAETKWPELKKRFPGINLHFIGHLQSKKAKKALDLFNVIETLDSEKLAAIIAKNLTKTQDTDLYIQVNIGEEEQKYGILPQNTSNFIEYCKNDLKLNITGLMCMPPKNHNPSPYFAYLKELAKKSSISYLSQGMSSDFQKAIEVGTSEIRVGSAIFGPR